MLSKKTNVTKMFRLMDFLWCPHLLNMYIIIYKWSGNIRKFQSKNPRNDSAKNGHDCLVICVYKENILNTPAKGVGIDHLRFKFYLT
jgi:hypothetical protein